jgi:hypothetical protein
MFCFHSHLLGNEHNDIIATKTSQVKLLIYITTDGQSASPSWCQAPLSDPQPIFSSFLDLFSDEKDIAFIYKCMGVSTS